MFCAHTEVAAALTSYLDMCVFVCHGGWCCRDGGGAGADAERLPFTCSVQPLLPDVSCHLKLWSKGWQGLAMS